MWHMEISTQTSRNQFYRYFGFFLKTKIWNFSWDVWPPSNWLLYPLSLNFFMLVWNPNIESTQITSANTTIRNPNHGYLGKTLRHSLIDHIFHLDFQSLVFVCNQLLLQRMVRLVHFFKYKNFRILFSILSSNQK